MYDLLVYYWVSNTVIGVSLGLLRSGFQHFVELKISCFNNIFVMNIEEWDIIFHILENEFVFSMCIVSF